MEDNGGKAYVEEGAGEKYVEEGDGEANLEKNYGDTNAEEGADIIKEDFFCAVLILVVNILRRKMRAKTTKNAYKVVKNGQKMYAN